MRLAEHLVELRKRLVISALAIIVASVGGFIISEWLLSVLEQPLRALAEDGRATTINFTTVTEAFDLRMRIAVTAGIIVSSPVWLYQIIRFFLPGLHGHERRYVFGFLAAALPLFLAGCVAGWYTFPHIVQVLVGLAPSNASSLLAAGTYYDFAFKLILAIGIGFVLPVVVVFLNFAGVVQGRTILRSWRWAVLGITLFTATATPAADVMSMFLLAIPMLLLYFAACLVAILNDRRRARRAATAPAGQPA